MGSIETESVQLLDNISYSLDEDNLTGMDYTGLEAYELDTSNIPYPGTLRSVHLPVVFWSC